jgi:hypothetical protein
MVMTGPADVAAGLGFGVVAQVDLTTDLDSPSNGHQPSPMGVLLHQLLGRYFLIQRVRA